MLKQRQFQLNYFFLPLTMLFILTACQSTADTLIPTATPALSLSTPTPTAILPPPTELPPTPQPTASPTALSESTQSPTDNQSPFPTSPLPLDTFPRPRNDNGLGVHWSTHLYAQPDEATAYFMAELEAMNIKWVKLLVDGLTNHDYDHTIDELVSRDIMPVIRIYQECNTPYASEELDALVRHYVAKGVYYFETYNEPNQPGKSGGWCQADGVPQPEYLAQVWAEAARTIYLAGGYPGIPSFFAPSQKIEGWEQDFFYRFFQALQAQGNESVLYFSWAAIHNYHLNHPPTFPYETINLTSQLLTDAEIAQYNLTEAQIAHINQARLTARDPGGFFLGDNSYDDVSNFFHFIAYRQQFYDLFGFDIPLISTEGGATRGSEEDPRYPKVDGPTVAEWTLWSADYMLDDAPSYYFTTMTWLLAQAGLEYGDPTWESNAWYHDRNGDQEPVVDVLKNRPRLIEARQLCPPTDRTCWAAKVQEQPDINPLAAYPRPPSDNGRGIHWIPTNQPLPPEITDYFVTELQAMNIKWVKFLQDDLPHVSDPYLVEQLVANDIEPIMRVFKPINAPYQHLPQLVTQAKGMGVHYFELYNEPNLAGFAGGWAEDQAINVARIVDWWILAARDVQAAGGHPSLPPLAGGGTVDDMVFLRQFLAGVRARGQADLFPGAWIPVHNYFLNHPLDYPADPVNVDDVLLTEEEITARGLTPDQVEAINKSRQMAKLPREEGGFWVGNSIDEDSNAFGKYEAYANIFYDRFGYHLPVISTEGGAVIGSAEDPRYPPIREEDVTTLTIAAYHAVLDEAPSYFFAHTPWILANSAGGHPDERFENAAWYKDRDGTTLAVVEALKEDVRKDEVRVWDE
ncbi:MAG: hypothetical protein AAF485_04755 [Chloroflexota bacterium]